MLLVIDDFSYNKQSYIKGVDATFLLKNDRRIHKLHKKKDDSINKVNKLTFIFLTF